MKWKLPVDNPWGFLLCVLVVLAIVLGVVLPTCDPFKRNSVHESSQPLYITYANSV